MPRYDTPGAYIEVSDPASAAIHPIRTDIAGFVGMAARGPLDTPVRVVSWAQFQTTFGAFLPNAHLAYSVRLFFENGGRECHVVRVAAPGVETWTVPDPLAPAQALDLSASAGVFDATGGVVAGAAAALTQVRSAVTLGAQPFDRLSSLLNDVSGLPAGSAVRVLQAGRVAHMRAQSAEAATQRVFWARPLPAWLDIMLPMAFEADQQTTVLVSAVAGNRISWAPPLPQGFGLNLPAQLMSGAQVATAEVPGAACACHKRRHVGQWPGCANGACPARRHGNAQRWPQRCSAALRQHRGVCCG
jgi:uncharacterized protein